MSLLNKNSEWINGNAHIKADIKVYSIISDISLSNILVNSNNNDKPNPHIIRHLYTEGKKKNLIFLNSNNSDDYF